MAPPQGGAFDFELSAALIALLAVAGSGPPLRTASSASDPKPSWTGTPVLPLSPVTAVTVRDAFSVDLTLPQTYSQAQGVV
jgi:hypothetical protein